MLNLIEHISAQTVRQLYAVLPQDYVTAYTLFALLDSFAVNGAWVQTEDDVVTAVVLVKEQGQAFVAASEAADFEELRYFLRALGGVMLHAAPETMRSIGATPTSSHGLLVLKTLPELCREVITVTEDLEPIYRLLTQSAKQEESDSAPNTLDAQNVYREWLSTQSRGIFGGYTVVKAVFSEENNLRSTAIADLLGDFVYIRDVATDANFRNRGYGRDCVVGLCKALKTEQNTVFLLSSEKKTEHFYQKCGFQKEATIELGFLE